MLLAAPAWADIELFASTEARPWQGMDRLTERFAAIEPAAGASHAAEARSAPSSSTTPKDEPDMANEAEPHAEEESSPTEGHAKTNADSEKALENLKAENNQGGHPPPKDLEGKPTDPNQLPKVTIGGQEVMTYRAKTAKDVSESTPSDLQGPVWKEILEKRFNITPYAHDPVQGQANAPIQVIIFEDLSCGQCLPTLGQMDTALAAYTSETSVVHVHAPLGRLQNTNLPAFYGKVAARMGKFWEYRAALVSSRASTPDTVLDALLKTGVRERDVRSLMMTESRRFYREIDADVLLGRSFAVGQPPIAFVNGIRVGTGGIPLDKLGDVLHYVSSRIARGLPEPPQ